MKIDNWFREVRISGAKRYDRTGVVGHTIMCQCVLFCSVRYCKRFSCAVFNSQSSPSNKVLWVSRMSDSLSDSSSWFVSGMIYLFCVRKGSIASSDSSESQMSLTEN